MGCFLGCFGGRSNRRRQKLKGSDHARENKLSIESAESDHLNHRIVAVEEISIPISEIRDNADENCSPSLIRKRVTFDSRVETYEHIVLQESLQFVEERSSSSSENVVANSNSSDSYPSNHRYKNCRESDDDDDDEEEEDGFDCDESDLDEDEEYYSDDGFGENELHNPIKEMCSEDTECNGLETGKIEAKPRGVLNPIENLTQWKSAKSEGKTIQKHTQKENSSFHSDQEEEKDSSSLGTDTSSLSLKRKSRIEPKKQRNQESTVDASLSTWLSTSETTSECSSVSMETLTPEKHKSSCYSKLIKSSHEDRPILCALTLKEVKQFSATSTPSKSPSKSPDETPTIGTVGGYWGNHSKANDHGSASSFKGIPNTTSKYREDNKVKWHSTPFEARLEKALNNRD